MRTIHFHKLGDVLKLKLVICSLPWMSAVHTEMCVLQNVVWHGCDEISSATNDYLGSQLFLLFMVCISQLVNNYFCQAFHMPCSSTTAKSQNLHFTCFTCWFSVKCSRKLSDFKIFWNNFLPDFQHSLPVSPLLMLYFFSDLTMFSWLKMEAILSPVLPDCTAVTFITELITWLYMIC